jgi:hypothetical protein
MSRNGKITIVGVSPTKEKDIFLKELYLHE